ncbi:MAG: hypothetical protein ABI877_22810 [Gemmatimonadaceae bacterium]
MSCHRAFVAFTLFAAVSVHAQSAPAAPPPLAQQAAFAKLNAGDFAGALRDCQKLVSDDPHFGRGHVCVGVALIGLARYKDALAALDLAEQNGAVVPQVAFRKGMAHAALGEADEAFRELRRAADAGLPAAPVPVETDPAFARVRKDPRLKTFLTAVDRNVHPCKYDARYREFDFWIGDWDVRPNGAPPTQPPARNTVTLEQDGCVVMEHWSALASNGQSFNIFDSSYGIWRQTWVDNVGGQHDYRGSLQNDNMVFRGEIPPLPGQTARQNVRLTFVPIHRDTVRQHAEVTSDSGATWSTSYDLIYSRRKE